MMAGFRWCRRLGSGDSVMHRRELCLIYPKRGAYSFFYGFRFAKFSQACVECMHGKRCIVALTGVSVFSF
mgnify:CR=1 FL=1